jgi:hypothetical protein
MIDKKHDYSPGSKVPGRSETPSRPEQLPTEPPRPLRPTQLPADPERPQVEPHKDEPAPKITEVPPFADNEDDPNKPKP